MAPGFRFAQSGLRIEHRMLFSTELLVQTLIAGVMIGVLYALMALGITFIYSIVKMINWSMGEFYMIGGYVQFLLISEWLGADLWWVAAPLSALGVFLVGYLLAPVFMVYPTSGVVTTVKGFEIIVIGGLGSIPGALIAGVMLGIVESLGAAFVAAPYQNAYGFLLVVLVLLVRPTGLFGERSRAA